MAFQKIVAHLPSTGNGNKTIFKIIYSSYDKS